ncbi:cytosolic leucyl tRNA synthetase [Elasticomyces elasticus]|nr:cytosolic leucyl tRNA synthetase [Elasticomyces elasticus]
MAAVQPAEDALDPTQGSSKTLKIENTEKRDNLIAVEKKYQKAWAEARIFEQDAPSLAEVPFHSVSPAELRKKQPKFMGTMAYPYMNGTLHAGHSFTASKVEFATGWARMQGKRALFPQGYHCTGMPIKACADKLVREIEMFGEKFENYKDPVEEVTNGVKDMEIPAPVQETTKEDITKFTTKKSKAAAKTNVALKYQFQIMLALGIPKEEIHRFANPQHWLQFFPPLCKRDLTNFGARIDWRRSMVTTDANPYYDAFVRWQMNRLKELGKIKFGKRYTVYSPKDGQACMDHDRSKGEGIGVQEYTALKLKVKEWSDTAKSIVSNALPENTNVYFVPATLRPETMYGQTCCFVGPKIQYGIYKVSDTEYYFITDRAARNMAFQGIFSKWAEFPKVADLKGSDVIGTLVNAPLSVHREGVRILPMGTVKDTKGTGVVTSVPSDSPDDYATVLDLAKKAEYYGIKREWAELEILPIIETPSYGNLTAKTLVERLKINGPNDTKLAEAKDLAYKEGFYKGVMCHGEFKGRSVEEAKPLVRQQLIDSSDAFNYAEPDGEVISRSGDTCVAGHLDQWYLNYGKTEKGGDGEWQQTVLKHIMDGGLNTFTTEAKNQFEQTLDWLAQWACARSYGLGSRLPWDQNFIVESLSDSTIYMSYYTISHQLHGDMFGRTKGPANIAPEQMTDEVWDYVFTRREDVKTDIPQETLHAMRREFEYWYPLDLRVSGKDLIQNHLTFFLYVHIALFPREYWPEAIRVNGHLLLNGEKMSKSTGNFLTLADATSKFGADATRIALADAGDGIEDANFEESVANATILKLYELKKWCEDMMGTDAPVVKSSEEYIKERESKRHRTVDMIQRSGEKTFWDRIFENELHGLVRETRESYDATSYKVAIKCGLYDFTSARDYYREATKAAGQGMHRDLVARYIELQALMITVIAPHWSEYIWQEVLGKTGTIQNELFPVVDDTDLSLTAAREYVRTTSGSITSAEGAQQKKMAKGKSVSYDPKKEKKLSIFVALKYPAWQEKYIDIVRAATKERVIDMKAVTKQMDKSETKKAMPFVQSLKRSLDSGVPENIVFERKLAFDEVMVLKEMVPGLRQTLQKCVSVELVKVDEGGKTGVVVGGTSQEDQGRERTELPPPAENAVPGGPTFHFDNV